MERVHPAAREEIPFRRLPVAEVRECEIERAELELLGVAQLAARLAAALLRTDGVAEANPDARRRAGGRSARVQLQRVGRQGERVVGQRDAQVLVRIRGRVRVGARGLGLGLGLGLELGLGLGVGSRLGLGLLSAPWRASR